MSKAIVRTADDKKWETEEDVRNFEHATEVYASPVRLKRALAMLKSNEEKSSKTRMDIGRILRMKNRKDT